MNCFGSWGAMSPVLRETAQSQKVRYRDGVRQMAGVANNVPRGTFLNVYGGFGGKLWFKMWFRDGSVMVNLWFLTPRVEPVSG